jgi:hypothetical protein
LPIVVVAPRFHVVVITPLPIVAPLFVVNVTPIHLKVLCHLKLHHVSTNVLGLRYEEEKFPPPCYFVVVKVWTFRGCWSGGVAIATRGVSLSWVFLNPCATPEGHSILVVCGLVVEIPSLPFQEM